MTEIELIRAAQAGCRKSQGALIRMHAGYLHLAVNRYNVPGYERADLLQLAGIGLLEAIPLFKPEMNFKFLTFARFHIKKQLNIALQAALSKRRYVDMVSLDQPVKEDGSSLCETIPAEPDIENFDEKTYDNAKIYIDHINDSKLRGFALTLLESCENREEITLKNTGLKNGFSRERARQLRVKIAKVPPMKELRKQLYSY